MSIATRALFRAGDRMSIAKASAVGTTREYGRFIAVDTDTGKRRFVERTPVLVAGVRCFTRNLDGSEIRASLGEPLGVVAGAVEVLGGFEFFEMTVRGEIFALREERGDLILCHRLKGFSGS